MMRCTKCQYEFDETVAAGICPWCGSAVPGTVGEAVSMEGTADTVPLYQTGGPEAPPVKRVKALTPEEQEFEDPRWLPAGTVLKGRYQVCRHIGSGGFGITYRVWDMQNGVYKAVKEYFQQGLVNRVPGTTEVVLSSSKHWEEFQYGKERLLNEARIVAKFQSSSIVRVDDFFEENNTAYMVMEYLDMSTLENRVVGSKRLLDPEEAVEIAVHICDALEEIHQAGVLHRDIAPDNIFVAEDGRVKIIDFGSARLSREDIDNSMIVLKPGFAPPEQYEQIDLQNDRQQAWTDVYALGATLYMCLTGHVPAESTNRKADFDTDTDRVRYPHEINPRIPEFLSNVIMTAMAINIHERFQTVAQMRAALLQERKVLPVEVVRRKKRIRRTVGIGASIVLILALAATGIWRYFERKNDVVLNEAVVSIWYCVSSDSALASQKNDTFQAMKAELAASDKFSQVTVELTAVPEDEYAARLEEAHAAGRMPLIFESADPGAPYMEDVEPMEDVLDRIETDSCYFLDAYDRYFSDDTRIPMGFNVPVIYVNTTLVPDCPEDFGVAAMGDLMTLCGGEMAYKPMTLSEDLRSSYEAMFSDFSDYGANMEGYTMEDFLNGETVACFSDTADYYTVRNILQSSFRMIPITAPTVICRFCDYWSISNCQADEERAAKEILAYFFSNNIQDQYYVQTNLSGLPLEKTAVAEYAWVTRSLADFLEDLSRYSFEKQ